MSTTERQLLEAVKSFFTLNGLSPEKGIIVAFSGGADSLSLLLSIKKAFPDAGLCAVYVNHRLRSGAELADEINLNRDNCKKLGVEFVLCDLGEGAVMQYARQKRCGTEAAARALRYENLETERVKRGFSYIAVAHNKDDNFETVYMRMQQKKALFSMAGIAAVSGRVIRPLLEFSHAELCSCLTSGGFVWSEDSTNKTGVYLRNKIRLSDAVKNNFEKIAETMEEARKMRSLAQKTVEKAQGNSIRLEYLQNLTGEELNSVLFLLWDRILCEDFVPLTRGMLGRITSAIRAGESRNLSGGGVTVSLYMGKLFIFRKAEPQFQSVPVRDKVALPGGYTLVRNPDGESPKSLKTEKGVFIFPSLVSGDLSVRLVGKGDSIALKGGRKTVLSLLKDSGVPAPLRAFVPVICDSDEIVAVMGAAYGGRDRIARKLISSLAPNNSYLYIVL